MNELMIKKFRESCDYNIVLIGFMGAGKSTVAPQLPDNVPLKHFLHPAPSRRHFTFI